MAGVFPEQGYPANVSAGYITPGRLRSGCLDTLETVFRCSGYDHHIAFALKIETAYIPVLVVSAIQIAYLFYVYIKGKRLGNVLLRRSPVYIEPRKLFGITDHRQDFCRFFIQRFQELKGSIE